MLNNTERQGMEILKVPCSEFPEDSLAVYDHGPVIAIVVADGEDGQHSIHVREDDRPEVVSAIRAMARRLREIEVSWQARSAS